MEGDGQRVANDSLDTVRRNAVDRYLTRKNFVTTLGVAGLGLGMTAAALGGAPAAGAQDADAPSAAEAAEMKARFEEMQAELYAAFTAALAEELGTGDAAQVDGGIRAALAAVVDGFAGDDLVTPGQATAVKALIETAEVPVGPGPLMGHDRFRFAGGMGPAGGPPTGDSEAAAAEGELPVDGRQAMAERFYPDFTAALASELGAGSADEVDGAIRLAMISVIDGIDTEAMPMPIPTDALKAMVATSDGPLGPAMLFGGHPGMIIRAFHGHGGPGFHGRGGDDDGGWFGERGSDRDEAGDDASEATDEAEDEASA